MNAKLFVTLLSLSVSLSAIANPAFACPTGNPRSAAYIRRDNNRCEGLNPHNVSTHFRLLSFTAGTPDRTSDILKIRIPGLNREPEFQMRSQTRNYLLDRINAFLPKNRGMEYNLNTELLFKKLQIQPRSLQATARAIDAKGKTIYYPVILNQSTKRYEFLLYFTGRNTFRTVEIRKNNQTYYKFERNFPQDGTISLTWDYGNAPAGEYQLYLQMEQQQPGRPAKYKERTISFQHNPELL